ncbi:uncharacterized protein G2W53_030314 [Senna tora]|uniref:Uncharacterized protein n=1 Tax=Senna tora TaxID=362788 RepID=A0A834T781_9FABA|nr:uncharacterized protein G2W53_030314 [Senna tora]
MAKYDTLIRRRSGVLDFTRAPSLTSHYSLFINSIFALSTLPPSNK